MKSQEKNYLIDITKLYMHEIFNGIFKSQLIGKEVFVKSIVI